MNLEKLKIEKNKIINLHNDYFNRLINEIILLKKEITDYKFKIDESQTTINQLTLEIELKDEELVKNKRKITELRSELTNAENEIYNLRTTNTYTKLELIKDLKEAYIKFRDYEVEEILDEILEEINIIEDKISEDDMMVIMYLSYIYDRLQVILGTSSMANNYYSSLNKEAKLLKIISQEENCKPYARIDESTQSYISKEKDLFNKLDIKLKKRIIENLYDMSYKTFNGVYKESDMELEDSTINIKAWVKEENDVSWKLINAIYSQKNERIYLPENMIKILGLKINKNEIYTNVELIDFNIRRIKEVFLEEKCEVLKSYMDGNGECENQNTFIELSNFNITSSTITLNDAYNILLISLFYRMQNIFINRSNYLKDIYYSETLESKFIRGLANELNINEGSKINLPSTTFLMYNKDKIINIEQDIKIKAFNLINLYFFEQFDNIIISKDNNYKNCIHDKNNLKIGAGYLEYSNTDGSKKYYLIKDKCCNECNTVYINTDKYNKINIDVLGYKLSPAKIDIIKNNEHLYNSLLNYFIDNNIEKAIIIFNKIIEDIDILKSFNNMQKITLLFIGYLIKRTTLGATKIINSGDINTSVDTILYKKLSEGRDYIKYLNEYRNSLRLIDPKVKNEIIDKIFTMYKCIDQTKKDNMIINQADFDNNNLNAESEIKKMGYSTSLSKVDRWNILTNKAIPCLGKAKVMGHIGFLIKMNKNRSNMSNAVREWTYDLERLQTL
ncbi:hypothetical protein [uncultured Clostridium sp.]|uniref:hypothetical protein n=1 Tax=uncultured Clostridium sp. TaxID=59620 RepID=UPI00262D554E|nr:hypothetical protein [uncultured Clostridium sp.]